MSGRAGSTPPFPLADRRCLGHVALHARLDRYGRPAGGGLRRRIDNEPNFLGTVGVLFVQGVTADYSVTRSGQGRARAGNKPKTCTFTIRDALGLTREGRRLAPSTGVDLTPAAR